jgi:hypothetical protein
VADVSVVLMVDGAPVAKLHLSYTATKTLAENIRQTVDVLEEATSHKIMVSSEVEAGLRKHFGEGEK